MTTPLFEDPAVYAAGGEQRHAEMRAYALGGVLQVLRASNGWSVEQAAVHAGLGHMTWRRMEDGFSVRNKTYAAIDTLMELPFGTVKRALADDLLMVQLIAKAGVDTSTVTTASAGPFVERFAKQTLSKAAKQTLMARATGGASTRPPVGISAASQVSMRAAAAFGQALVGQIPTPQLLPQSDLAMVAATLDRITRRHLTPRLEKAVRALLDAMPDLIERTLVEQSEALPADSADPHPAEHDEHEGEVHDAGERAADRELAGCGR